MVTYDVRSPDDLMSEIMAHPVRRVIVQDREGATRNYETRAPTQALAMANAAIWANNMGIAASSIRYASND